MQNLESVLTPHLSDAFNELYNTQPSSIDFQATRKDFEGDITFVTFPHLRITRKSPEQTGEQLGAYLVEKSPIVSGYNVVKGFLNIVVSDDYWKESFGAIHSDENYGLTAFAEGRKASMVEYSSPNTNKPLHLGHIRNNLLGHSVAEIIKANGQPVSQGSDH